MVISKSLLLKGLGVCAVCIGAAVAIHQRKSIASLLSSNPKLIIGGLECGREDGSECNIKGEVLVKLDNGAHFKVSDLGSGKIRLHKDSNYTDNFKFVIEDSDISGSGNNKLEEFETYETKLGEESEGDDLKGKRYLLRKTKAKEEIKNALRLPWDLPDSGSQEQTDITNENLKNIKFEGGTATVSGNPKLIISKISSDDYPLGYKFTFSSTSDETLTIGGTSIPLKNGSDVDFKIKKNGSSLSLEKAWSLEILAKKVGLKKTNEEEYWDIEDGGLNIKQDSIKELNRTKKSGGSAKIKVEKDQRGYNQGFRFSIEKGDVNLNHQKSSSIILGQFQSYEIVRDDDGQWYLSRREGDQSKIKDLLGLPCDLPTNDTPKECTIDSGGIGTIRFEGAGNSNPTLSGSLKLTVSRVSERLDYPLGYKFVLTSASDTSTISISSDKSIVLKGDMGIDFKIKISGENKETLALEKAWTADTLMELVYLDKNEKEGTWSIGGGGILIKQGSNKSDNSTVSGPNNAKIKVYENEPEYNQGFKFVVEGGDTNLDGSNSIGKLTKYETYEVSKDGDGQWYFTRKKTEMESIKKFLGIPETCTLPSHSETSKDCSLNLEKLKSIGFEGKGDSGEVTIGDSGDSVILKMAKTSDNNFPKGYKFILVSDKEVTIPQSSGGNTSIKKNTDTEFKIKESGGKFTLERAWNINKLGGKVGLTECGSNSESKCSFGSSINVYENESTYVNGSSISSGNKISYQLDQDDHSQGIKFFVEGNDIDITNGTPGGPSTVSKINKRESETPTYEIREKTIKGDTKWYLVKKSS